MARARKSTSKSASAQDQPRRNLQPEALAAKIAEPEPALTSALASSSAYANQAKEECHKVEDREKGAFQGFSEIASAFCSIERAREVAALSIETSERLAKSALDFQANACEWAKDTPLGPLFEAQNSIARKFVQSSVDAARRFWKVDERQAA